jgi:1,4-alpha-glucan branching enzyme
MPVGYFSLILHAHLPFVRHPEYPEFLEEDWLYEAITEVYLPLIFIFQSLHEAGVAPRLAVNVSPTLCEMLADKLLEERYTRHLENLIELAVKELDRNSREATEFVEASRMYVDTLTASLGLWNDRYGRNLINAFRELQDEGVLEIITCGATHGFLPLISTLEARRAQIDVAVRNYKKHFGRQPRGIWLPECAYEPGIEDLLKDAGIEYFISDTHAILYGDPRPRYGVHSPVSCPNGTAVFARDLETSQQVWSAEAGYPGAPVYREFYRDIGWDLPLEYLAPHLHAEGNRRHLGLKYYRITGKGVPQQMKQPYLPSLAREKAAEDASHFLGERIKQAHELRETFEGRPPLVVSPYDAELYGHWWYEGPQFIDFLFRKLHFDQDSIAAITPGDFLDSGIPIQIQQPSASSWGENGYYKVWLNEKNAWMYPYQHDAERKMTELADRARHLAYDARDTYVRVLDQMARELLLAESSDWAFQIYQGTTVEYSSRRFRSHIHRFHLLAKMLPDDASFEGLELSPEQLELLAEIESRDNIFAEMDFRIYATADPLVP